MIPLFLFAFGLIIGSFLSMLTYRLPRELSLEGRSYCDHCGKKISWFENIPLISYLLLRGRCKECQRHISLRYPIIEALTGTAFALTYFAFKHPTDYQIYWIKESFGPLGLVYVLILLSLFIALFIIDLETQLLPDRLLQILLFFALAYCFLLPSPFLFQRLLWGFLSGCFFLLIYLLTRERGLGFGDVKLGFIIGLLLGFPHTIVWILLSFISGSIIGIIMLSLKLVRLGQPIPFGPILIASAIVSMLFGSSLFIWYISLFAL